MNGHGKLRNYCYFCADILIYIKNIINLKTMPKVITFGEIMLRLSTPGYLRFSQAKQFEATFGGGEANVAVSLAN